MLDCEEKKRGGRGRVGGMRLFKVLVHDGTHVLNGGQARGSSRTPLAVFRLRQQQMTRPSADDVLW